MKRWDVLNKLIGQYGYSSYLEIGTRLKETFDKIGCDRKVSVDPAKNHIQYDFNMTSDEFFRQNTQKFDLIFIDGLHLAEQVEKDVANALEVLNVGGAVVLHDTNPPTEFHQLESLAASQQTPAGVRWNGTVWKAVYKLRSTRSDLVFVTYDCDWGVTVVTRGASTPVAVPNTYYSYQIFEAHREEILNLVPCDPWRGFDCR